MMMGGAVRPGRCTVGATVFEETRDRIDALLPEYGVAVRSHLVAGVLDWLIDQEGHPLPELIEYVLKAEEEARVKMNGDERNKEEKRNVERQVILN